MAQPPNDFVTRADLRAELEASEKRIHDHITDLALRLERAETALLNGFRNYTRVETVRTKALETRVEELERRMLNVELDRITPPPDEQSEQ